MPAEMENEMLTSEELLTVLRGLFKGSRLHEPEFDVKLRGAIARAVVAGFTRQDLPNLAAWMLSGGMRGWNVPTAERESVAWWANADHLRRAFEKAAKWKADTDAMSAMLASARAEAGV